MLESTMDVVNSCLINAMRLGRQKHVQSILENIAKNESVDHIRIFDQNGKIKFASDIREVGEYMNAVAPGHTELGTIDQKKVTLLDNQRIYSVTSPILNRSDCQRCHGTAEYVAYLDIDTNLTQAEVYFHTGSLHMIFLAVAILTVLFLGFYFIFHFFINKPLHHFKKALDEVEKGNLDVVLPAKKPDEIGLLEGHFNNMVLNLKESKEKIDELHFEQLQRADKLVTLGELAAEMAHEINNPAGIIMSRTDFIQMGIKNNPGLNKYNEDLNVVLKQIEKISKITGNILKFSKKLPKEFNKINLHTISDECLNILGPRLAKNKITVYKDFQSKDAEILGDAVQMEQVFTNLVNNAIDAVENDGELTIGTKDVDSNHLLWILKDSGNGMDDNIKDQIFTPFFTTKPANKGTGLGLYIVKNICKNHNADIEFESKPKEGSVFKITFLKSD
jgi:signal transduction histidine kinase